MILLWSVSCHNSSTYAFNVEKVLYKVSPVLHYSLICFSLVQILESPTYMTLGYIWANPKFSNAIGCNMVTIWWQYADVAAIVTSDQKSSPLPGLSLYF